MKKKYSIFLLLLVLAITIILFMNKDNDNLKSNNKVEDSYKESIKPINSLEDSYMNFFDEKGHLFKSYSEEQLKNLLIDTNLYKRDESEDGEKPFATFYDENGINLEPSEEIKAEMKKLSNSNEFKLFIFRQSSISSYIPVRNNTIFSKPQSIIIEPTDEFKSMSIILENSSGNRIGRIVLGNYLGGLIVPLEAFESEDSYSIQLVNNEQDPIYLNGGIVIYK
ncbi:hypothetical protein [Psychrobacillus sp. L4]|uniref:hypothetical protein n=1 Tax=Psychrobacillus sp. L4 TaxID=3236892 RepID=UPI0036F24865